MLFFFKKKVNFVGCFLLSKQRNVYLYSFRPVFFLFFFKQTFKILCAVVAHLLLWSHASWIIMIIMSKNNETGGDVSEFGRL